MSKVIAKKDLFFQTGELSFTKGQEYVTVDVLEKEIKTNVLREKTILIDNQGDIHHIGDIWLKHFKLVK